MRHKTNATLDADDAADLFQTLLRESGLNPVSCKPVVGGVRPGGSTIRIEFKEPVTVFIYNMRNRDVLVDVDIYHDDMLAALGKVKVEVTKVSNLKPKLLSTAKLAEQADDIMARDLEDIGSVLEKLAIFADKVSQLKEG